MEVRGKRERKTGKFSSLRLNVNSQKRFDDGIFVVKNPVKFRNDIQELMNLNAGIIREETKAEIWTGKNFEPEEGVLF